MLLAALVTLVGSAVSGTAFTGGMHEWLQQQISSLLSGPGRHVVIKGMRMHLATGHIDRIVVTDPGGTWMTFGNIALEWDPLSLIEGVYHFRQVSIQSLSVYRMPEPQTGKSHKVFSLPNQPLRLPNVVPVRIDHLKIAALDLKKPILGNRAVFRVEGHLNELKTGPGLEAFLHLVHQAKHGPTSLRLDARIVQGRPQQLFVNAHLAEAAGGLTAHLLHLPGTGAISLSLQGQGPIADWQGQLKGRVRRLGRMRSRLILWATKAIHLELRGRYDAPDQFLLPKLASLLKHQNRFDVLLSLTRGKLLRITRGEIWSRDGRLEFAGAVHLPNRSIDAGWVADIKSLSDLQPLIGQPLSGKLHMQGTVKGTRQQSEAALKLRIDSLQSGSFGARQITGRIKMDLQSGGGLATELHAHATLLGTDLKVADSSYGQMEFDLQGWNLLRRPSGKLSVGIWEHEREFQLGFDFLLQGHTLQLVPRVPEYPSPSSLDLLNVFATKPADSNPPKTSLH